MKQIKLIQPEDPKTASADREDCIKCLLFQTCQTPFMKAYVPKGWTQRVLLIGEGPGYHEDNISFRPFTGDAGKLLRDYLIQAGYKRHDCAFSNAVRCRPINNATPSTSQIKACRPFILWEINHLKPDYVVLLGKTAVKSVLGSKAKGSLGIQRGRAWQIDGIKHKPNVIITYHPAAVLRGGPYGEAIQEDLKRPFTKSLTVPGFGKPTGRYLGFDTEYYFNKNCPVRPMVLTAATASDKAVCSEDKVTVPQARKLLGSAEVLCGHAIEHDLDCLVSLGLAREDWLRGVNILDSLLLKKMVNENDVGKGVNKLETLFLQNFKTESWKGATELYGDDPRKWPVAERTERCGRDAWATYLLCKKYSSIVKGPVVFNHRITQTLHRIYLTGAVANLTTWKRLKRQYTIETNTLREKITRLAHRMGMKEFSPTNDGHIRELVYSRLKCPVTNRTAKTNLPATDKVTLDQYSETQGVKELIAFSASDKVLSTYLLSLPQLWTELDSDRALLRFPIRALGARTTRRSSAKPNAQNWPPSVKQMIISRYKGGKILSVDYSKLEPLLMAWACGDQKLFDFFYSGNGYVDIARELWKKEVKEGTPEYRTTKSISLGVNYNMQAEKMARELWFKLKVRFSEDWREHVRVTDKYRQSYLKMFPGISKYIEERTAELLRDQSVRIATGAVRHLPCVQGRDTLGFGHLVNEAVNAPIQGLAAAVTGSAMIDVESALLDTYGLTMVDYHTALLNSPKEKLNMALLLNEIHDELVFDVPLSNLKRDLELIMETMQSVPTFRKLVPDLTFPFKVKAIVSSSWGGLS